ncbi:MAG: adenosylhomocysteinase [Alphaproteobacteria bacterium]|nr:adenosylhomocysteinase [Alphaproteobacteria bacterium]
MRLEPPSQHLQGSEFFPLATPAPAAPSVATDPGASERGEQKILTASLEMRGLTHIQSQYETGKPLRDVAILGCVTVTPQTAQYILALRALGASLSWCSDNQYASDPDVVAYLRDQGIPVFAKANMSTEEYFGCMDLAIDHLDQKTRLHVNDDGCDITRHILETQPDKLARIDALVEQTTCGANALKNLYRRKLLSFPAIDVNGAFLKGFDNYYGTQQSVLHALTNIGITIASRQIAIVGYGSVGQGVARALRAVGASIGIVEADLLKLARAAWDGYQPMSIVDALGECDLILTASGCAPTITGHMIHTFARNGLILGNIGHGNGEYDIEWLSQHPHSTINSHRTAYRLADGRTVHSLCGGALLNFRAGAANPSHVMSLTFSLCLLAHIAVVREPRKFAQPTLHEVGEAAERECAEFHFPSLSRKLYKLSDQQRQYLALDA